jgi:hypothetical protein
VSNQRLAGTGLGGWAKEIIRQNILHPIIDVQLDDAPLQYYSRQ